MIKQMISLVGPELAPKVKAQLVMSAVVAAFQGAAFLVLAPVLRAFFDGDTASRNRWFWVLAALALAYAVTRWAVDWISLSVSGAVVGALMRRYGDRLAELPIGYFAQERSGEASDLVTKGIVFAAAAPMILFEPIITALVAPAVVVVGAFFLDWRVGAVMAAFVPLIYLAYRLVRRRVARADERDVAAAAEAAARVIEYARVQPALRAAGDNTITARALDAALVEQHAATRGAHLAGAVGVGVFTGVVDAAVVAVTAVVAALCLAGDLPLAAGLALVILAVRFAEPIVHSGALSGGISLAAGTLSRLTDLMAEPTLPEPRQTTGPQGHSVAFEDVTFAYPGGPMVLDRVSFEVPQGSLTAIVGPSGSGKTTIIRLLARFYDPDAGRVTIGGVPLPELGSAQVADAVAPVFQDVYLFDGTILENIALGRVGASRAEVEAAGRAARVDEIVGRLPGGWDARVGEGGTNLSGGERQRVSIARALLKQAPIVLLDEATAALDTEAEQAITKALGELRSVSTMVVVAHRMTTIAGADQIIMLDSNGRVAERGTHAELLAADGGYARYWNERSRAAGWRLAAG
ncbi:MAG: ABC transporter ATP-binding protein/permease [Bifidobacteriaceae bacterium]|jgi:ATP-binding cassette subfamily B protein|nr:ABC transporter ATP-binding protein/permease [Bifidobacteriaceae bacterium]